MGTHPIFESDFDCLTEMTKEVKRVFGFLPEICTADSESWSEQYYNIRAKFQVTTLTGLEELSYRDQCHCDVHDIHRPPPCPLEFVFVVDGSDSMSGKLLDGATNFMKNFVKKVDDSVLKRRNQANITFTSVQFSGCGQKTKSYKPGMGYVKDSEIGKEKINFSGRLGMASEGIYHWRSYSTFTARTLLDQLENSDEKPSSFETEIETKIRNAALDGNSQLFLCLQDIAIAAENKSGFYKNVSAKTSKYTDAAPRRIMIVLSDDGVFDNNEVKDLAVYGEKSENMDPITKKKKIMEMTARNFEELYFVAFKTSEKRDIKASMKNLMPASVDNVFPVDDNETQLEIARTMIFEKIGL